MVIYIASRAEDGGILRCSLSEDGQLELLEVVHVDRPAYLCRDSDKLYALLREPFQLMSGLNEYQIEQNGSLSFHGMTRSTHGLFSAHLYARAGKIWVANYIDGTVALLERGTDAPVQDRIIAFNGSGPDRDRQLSSHPHCVVPTPDGMYLCICDLGTDQIYTITPELEFVSACALPAGCGPRHIVFTRDGNLAFVSNEMGSSVSTLKYHNGSLELIKTVSTCPPDYTGKNTASAIRLSEDEEKLFVSNRGYDSIAVFYIDGVNIKMEGFIPSYGNSPREIAIAGGFLLCGNEFSDNVTVFPLHDELPSVPVCNFKVKMPWCILPKE